MKQTVKRAWAATAKTLNPLWAAAGAVGGVTVEVVSEAVGVIAVGAAAGILKHLESSDVLTVHALSRAALRGTAGILMGRYVVHLVRKFRREGEK